MSYHTGMSRMNKRKKTISEIFDEGKPIDAAVRKAVRKAVGRSSQSRKSAGPQRRARAKKA